MKTFIIRTITILTSAILGLGFYCLWTTHGPHSATRHEILKLANDFEAASARKDFVTLDRVTTDDFTVIRIDGSVINKAEYEEIIRNSDFIVDSFDINNVHVYIEGNQATVTGKLEMLAHLEGRDSIQHSSNIIYVFKKQQDRWQIVGIRKHSDFTP